MLCGRKDYGDGLKLGNMVFAAGYPDWLITTPLPPDNEKRPSDRWVWTGRMFAPIPGGLYSQWLEAHFTPMSLDELRRICGPYITEEDSATMYPLLFEAGMFVSLDLLEESEDLSSIGLIANPLTEDKKPLPNPLPGVIPDAEWGAVIQLDRLSVLADEARQRGLLVNQVEDLVQDLLRNKLALFVALPLVEEKP